MSERVECIACHTFEDAQTAHCDNHNWKNFRDKALPPDAPLKWICLECFSEMRMGRRLTDEEMKQRPTPKPNPILACVHCGVKGSYHGTAAFMDDGHPTCPECQAGWGSQP